jgi:hypothetical protein
MAAIRSKRILGLTAETFELLAKADLEISAIVDDDADIQNRVLGSIFGGE